MGVYMHVYTCVFAYVKILKQNNEDKKYKKLHSLKICRILLYFKKLNFKYIEDKLLKLGKK